MKRTIIFAFITMTILAAAASAQTGGRTRKQARLTGDWNGDGKDTIGLRHGASGASSESRSPRRIVVDPSDQTGNTYAVGIANNGTRKTEKGLTSRDGTSNTMMGVRVAVGDMNGDGSVSGNDYVRSRQGSGNYRAEVVPWLWSARSGNRTTANGQTNLVQGNHIGTNAVGTYSTQVGPNVRSRRRR